MKKFPIVVGIVSIVIIVGGVMFFSKDNSTNSYTNPSTYEFYWGEGCTHCANVEEFLTTWEKKDTVSIAKIEVFKDQANASKLLAAGNHCNLAQSEKGSVPLLVTPEGKCFLGDTPIIDFLKSL